MRHFFFFSSSLHIKIMCRRPLMVLRISPISVLFLYIFRILAPRRGSCVHISLRLIKYFLYFMRETLKN